MKTNKLLTKRIKVTASGKILHRSNSNRHLHRNKSANQKRKMAKTKEFANAYDNKIRKALGIA